MLNKVELFIEWKVYKLASDGAPVWTNAISASVPPHILSILGGIPYYSLN